MSAMRNYSANQIGETPRRDYLFGIRILINKTGWRVDRSIPNVKLFAHFFLDLPAADKAIAII
jgi:hypothetical protein